jgi:hypothetical protein
MWNDYGFIRYGRAPDYVSTIAPPPAPPPTPIPGPPAPPDGFAWVVYVDATGQSLIVTYTDPATSEVRPVIASLT